MSSNKSCRGDEESWQRQDEMRKFGKDKFRNCLRTILVDEMRKFGKEKHRNCLRTILVDEMRKFGKDKVRNCLRIFL